MDPGVVPCISPILLKLTTPRFTLSGLLLLSSLQKVDVDADDCPTVRAIMIYTRSDVLPTLPDKEVIEGRIVI